MILRGADEIKIPHGSVHQSDILYFTDCSFEWEVRTRGVVTSVFNSDRLSVEESFETIIRNQDKLQLPDKQFYMWAGKRYLVLIGVEKIEEVEPFRIDKAIFATSDGWFPIGDIKRIAMNTENFTILK